MSRAQIARTEHDGVGRLVEAERTWQTRLDDARARAAELVAAAEADVRDAGPELETSIRAAVEARTAELRASADAATSSAASDLASQASRYTNASPELVEQIATDIARRAPWFAKKSEGS